MACNDPALNAAAQQFKVPVLKSETGTEYVEDTTYYTYFVFKQFEGPEYHTLCKTPHRLVNIIIYYILMITHLKIIFIILIEKLKLSVLIFFFYF